MSAINPDDIEKNSTTGAFLSALAVNGALLLIEIGTFVVLKQKLWRIYGPRTVLLPPERVISSYLSFALTKTRIQQETISTSTTRFMEVDSSRDNISCGGYRNLISCVFH